jgi:TRAP-type C4-dicarboxylate transport system substrate-binding protein
MSFGRIAVTLLAGSMVVSVAHAQTITIKLGTLVPEGSSWCNLLKEMAERWSQATNGQVKLKIYAGGVAGNEGDMLRKVNIGQLQAAALSVVGLKDIDTAPQAIASPGLIADDKEWAYVFGKMIPTWDRQIESKGFVVLLWSDTGWVHLFLKKPIHSPSEMRGTKVFAWTGDEAQVKAWRMVGLTPIVLSVTDMIPSLSTGMIDAFASTPIIALAARWFEQAPYMTEATWCHLPGATVVAKSVWEKISPPARATLKAIAGEYAEKVNVEVTKMQADALVAMQKAGLTVLHFDQAGMAEWQALGEKAWPTIRGGVVTTAAFDDVKRARDEYRASH